MQHEELEPCGVAGSPSVGADEECRFGLRCTPVVGDVLRCPVPGTDPLGAPCTAASCEPGLGRHPSLQACVELGDLGAGCGPGDVPCRLGLICRDSLCAPP